MNVVVTAGGTRAPIDDVRHIANVSTGRFGASIAEAALRRGASVWYVHAPGALRPFETLSRFDLGAEDHDAEHDRLDRLRAEWLAVRDRYHPVPLRTGTVPEYSGHLEAVLRDRPVETLTPEVDVACRLVDRVLIWAREPRDEMASP